MFTVGRRNHPRTPRQTVGAVLLGLVLCATGGYLLTYQVTVEAGPFGGFAWFGLGSLGLVLAPLTLGASVLVLNPRLLVGRVLVAIGVAVLLASILDSVRFTFQPTSPFDVAVMLTALVVGIALLAQGVLEMPWKPNWWRAWRNDPPGREPPEARGVP